MPSMNLRWKARKSSRIGHDDDGGPGEEQAVVRGVLALGEQRQRDGQGVGVLGLRDDERPEEVVPAAEEGEDAQRRQGRPAQRQDDPREDPQLAGAVDAAGVEQVPGQAEDVLPHEEDPERRGEERQEQARQGVDEPGVRDEHELRHEGDDAGDHQRRQTTTNTTFLPWKSSIARA